MREWHTVETASTVHGDYNSGAFSETMLCVKILCLASGLKGGADEELYLSLKNCPILHSACLGTHHHRETRLSWHVTQLVL